MGENTLAPVIYQVFNKYRETSNYVNNGIKGLLLSSTEILGKDDQKLRVINQKLKSKCESQRVFLAAYRHILHR